MCCFGTSSSFLEVQIRWARSCTRRGHWRDSLGSVLQRKPNFQTIHQQNSHPRLRLGQRCPFGIFSPDVLGGSKHLESRHFQHAATCHRATTMQGLAISHLGTSGQPTTRSTYLLPCWEVTNMLTGSSQAQSLEPGLPSSNPPPQLIHPPQHSPVELYCQTDVLPDPQAPRHTARKRRKGSKRGVKRGCRM